MNNQTAQDEHPKSPPIPEPGETESAASQTQSDNAAAYNFVADKIGFVPNIRKSDNELQAKVFLGVWAACILIGAIFWGGDGVLFGVLLGIVVALVVSGGVLTIVGLIRKS